MAFTNLAVFGGAFFTPIVVGKITHTIMWWWTFNLVAIFCAVCLPLVIFFCPETAYRRDASLNTDMLGDDNETVPPPRYEGAVPPMAERQDGAIPDSAASPAGPSTEGSSDGTRDASNDAEKATAAPDAANGGANGAIPQKVTWRQSLALFNGRKSDEAFWKLLLRPLPLFLQPAFLWAALVQGTLIGWTVFIGVLLGMFFLGYPLWWNEVNTGYAYTGAFIGALGGFVVAGGLADWSAKVLTRWNGGIYEPEFRIVLVVPQLVFGCMGVYGFGITADGLLQDKFHWSVPIMFFGFEVCGMVIGAVASSLYIVDAYRKFRHTPFFFITILLP